MSFDSGTFPFGIMDVVKLLRLRIRRTQVGNVYVDCPFCEDNRGKMNVSFSKNVWRCNRCGESGGMLSLYAQVCKTNVSDAYREICKALCADVHCDGEQYKANVGEFPKIPRHVEAVIPQSQRASDCDIHNTFTALFELLTLKPQHRVHLKSAKRGLTDDQIDKYGFKSTPPKSMCHTITDKLIQKGCIVQGVPGFYLDDKENWTVKFSVKTSGILIPAVDYSGLICGAQIMLDTPLKDKHDPPDKAGAKYIWLSSSSKNMGITSGSPLLYIGERSAKTVYITEGLLKGYISHALTGKTFVAIAGVNNQQLLDELFERLHMDGCDLIIEAFDMDKCQNTLVAKAADKIHLTAHEHGMECRRLTWDPANKGFDDWQLALRRNETQS